MVLDLSGGATLTAGAALELVVAVAALCLAVGVGTVAHEFAHAAVLSLGGVPCEVNWLPERGGATLLRAGALGTWAAVTPRRLPDDTSPWLLRVAALAPLTLAAPGALVLAGTLPDPTAAGEPAVVAATLGWFACALPSPRDFSLVWYAERAIDRQ
ncbi:hypothetical protein [Halostella salina]|uniref:hypothetical protein n=1 Tax=Halostella salina TaxID=1547897 RepID=UPI000EF81810|nr:hypothetical protein [Halostella salina]